MRIDSQLCQQQRLTFNNVFSLLMTGSSGYDQRFAFKNDSLQTQVNFLW